MVLVSSLFLHTHTHTHTHKILCVKYVEIEWVCNLCLESFWQVKYSK
jgi:hypothetical protein